MGSSHHLVLCLLPRTLFVEIWIVTAVINMAAAGGAATGGAAAPAPAAAPEMKDDGTKVTLECKDGVKIECPTVIARQMAYLEAIPKDTAGDDDEEDEEEEGESGEHFELRSSPTCPVCAAEPVGTERTRQ